LSAVARDATGGAIRGPARRGRLEPRGGDDLAIGALKALATGAVEVTATVNGVSGAAVLTVVANAAHQRLGRHHEGGGVRLCERPLRRRRHAGFSVRSVRAEDGGLVLINSNAPRNYFSRGTDFNSLRRDCRQPALTSADRRTAESYENWEWLWAVYREGNRWHALIHNEFHDAVASTCDPGNPAPGNPAGTTRSPTRCPQTVPVVLETHSAGACRGTAPNVWVPPSAPLADGQWVMEGYFDPTNIVRANDGYYYALMTTIPSKYWWDSPSPLGLCTFRTDNLDDPASWRTWDGSGFNLRMTSPYVTGSPAPACALFFEPIRDSGHMVYSTYLNRYIHVAPSATDIGGRKVCGSTSRSRRICFTGAHSSCSSKQVKQLRFGSTSPSMLEPVPVQYPSIVDHADTTINFERAGRTTYLYYSRFRSVDYGPLYSVDRDLVRVPLTFTLQD